MSVAIIATSRCSAGFGVSHGGSRLLALLRLATSRSTRFGALSRTQLCERFSSLMVIGVLDLA